MMVRVSAATRIAIVDRERFGRLIRRLANARGSIRLMSSAVGISAAELSKLAHGERTEMRPATFAAIVPLLREHWLRDEAGCCLRPPLKWRSDDLIYVEIVREGMSRYPHSTEKQA